VRLRESAGSTTVSVHADVDMTETPLHVGADDTQRAARRLFSRLGDEVAVRIARDVEPAVRGTVRLVAPPVPTPAGAPRGLAGLVRRNPWVVPAALCGGAAALAVALRRRD